MSTGLFVNSMLSGSQRTPCRVACWSVKVAHAARSLLTIMTTIVTSLPPCGHGVSKFGPARNGAMLDRILSYPDRPPRGEQFIRLTNRFFQQIRVRQVLCVHGPICRCHVCRLCTQEEDDQFVAIRATAISASQRAPRRYMNPMRNLIPRARLAQARLRWHLPQLESDRQERNKVYFGHSRSHLMRIGNHPLRLR